MLNHHNKTHDPHQLLNLTTSILSTPCKEDKIVKEHNAESLLFQNIDIKHDIFSTKFEKDLKRLPSNLKFIRKYIYLEFMPKLEKIIGDLESIKQSANYDENISNVRPLVVKKLPNITCFDLFETNNIKNSALNKMIYGTINGILGIYDLESSKILIERQINPISSGGISRIDVLGTSSIKNFDSYITRIALQVRGDPNIQVMTFNHSYGILSNECVINLKDGSPNDSNILLSSLICDIKFSKDTYYIALTDYLGGVRIYKFNDLPYAGAIRRETRSDSKKENPTSMQFSFGSSKVQVFNNSNLIGASKQSDQSSSVKVQPVLVTYLKNKENENYTIIPSLNNKTKEEAITGQTDIKDQLKDKKVLQIQRNNRRNNTLSKKMDTSLGKKESTMQITKDSGFYESSNTTNPYYENKSIVDEKTSSDITPLQAYNSHHPFITLIQKKFITQDLSSGGYISSIITIGAYIGFYGNNNLKYISLYPYLTEGMKNISKVSMQKGAPVISQEDSISLSSQLNKKEKEYINFLKMRLDAVNSELNQAATTSAATSQDRNKEKVGNLRDKIQINSSDISYKETTKGEINFMMLFPITCLIGFNNFSKMINVICIGMKDGSILIWDTELHTDITLFKDKRAEIVQMSLDENFLISGSLDGQIHVYNMIEKKLIFSCYNSPQKNYPIQTIFPIINNVSIAIDHNQNIILYNTKEKHKAGKLILEHTNKNYKINYFNKILSGCNKDFVVFVTNKDKNEKVKPNLLEMILFQQQTEKPVLEEFNKPNKFYFNHFQDYFSKQALPVNKKSYLIIFKTKDILFKCYPQLLMAHKRGISLQKLLTKHDMNNLPSFNEDKFSNIMMLSDKFDKKNKNKPRLIEIVEQESEKDNDNDSSNSITDPAAKRKFSDKEFMKIKNDLIVETEPEKKNSFAIDSMNKDKNSIPSGPYEYKSTQKQNIFYYSYRNIRERYQYKEQRMNRIQARDERILKELKLPEIKIGLEKLKENKKKNY